MAQTNLIHRNANRIAILLDGIEVGGMQSCDASDSYGLEPASGIGDIHVTEHVATVARHSLSVTGLVLRKKSLRAAGVYTMNGDDALKGRVFDIAWYDKDTGEELRKYRGCSFDSGSIQVQKHAILVSSAQFMALDVVGDGV